jgi:uncharacterized membrane protein (DUF4010 family)
MKFLAQIEIPTFLVHFILVSIFSLLIGLAQRKKMVTEKQDSFGTDRTHTFIGIFGFICYHLDTIHLVFFGGGAVLIALFLGIYYFKKINHENRYGITAILIALITYCFAPLLALQPYWLSLLILVVILVLTEMKATFVAFTEQISTEEFITLAKFILMAGVILPLLPDKPIFSFIDLHPYKVWLSVVVISGISYFSYLLRKFIFKNSGIVLAGALGGLYSSTATTIIMAKRSQTDSSKSLHYGGAIIAAITVMYLRVAAFCLLMNMTLAKTLLPYVGAMFVVCLAVTTFFTHKALKKQPFIQTEALEMRENPLEIKFAVLSAILFITFSVITHFAIQYYGNEGLQVLSWLAGIADIDPFLLNIFQNTNTLPATVLTVATLQAVVSNNLLKAIVATTFVNPNLRKQLIMGFGVIIITNLAMIIWLWL